MTHPNQKLFLLQKYFTITWDTCGVEFSSYEISRVMEQISFSIWAIDKKTCAFVVMEIGNKVVWAGGGMGRGHQAGSVLFVGRQCHFVCVWAEGGLGRHDLASNVAQAAKYL